MRMLSALTAALVLAASWAPPAVCGAVAEEKAVGVETQKTPDKPPQDQRHEAGQGKRLEPPDAMPSVAGKVLDGDAQREGGGDHGGAKDQPSEGGAFWDAKATDYLVGLSTLLLVIVTGLLWWATRQLVSGADRNAARQLRAYVGIDDVWAGQYAPPNAPTRLTVRIRNYGQVAARDITIRLTWTDRRQGHALRPEDATPSDSADFALMPSATQEFGYRQAGGVAVADTVVVGRIIYEDGFGGRRFTNFRLLSRTSSDRFAPDSYGNDAS